MRPRAEGLLGLGIVAAAVVVAAILGRSDNPIGSRDVRPSTFVTGPEGASALAEALVLLGVEVVRHRRGLSELPADTSAGRRVVVLLQPSIPLSAPGVRDLVAWHRNAEGGDLVVAGVTAQRAMECLGWTTGPPLVNPVEASTAGGEAVQVTRLLIRSERRMVTDSGLAGHGDPEICVVPAGLRADTLLRTAEGGIAMLRLRDPGSGREAVLAADVTLFRNRSLRTREIGAEVLALFVGRYEQVVFEERHHGFGAAGSLLGAVLTWSRASPWGWAVWQLAVVGVLALLAAAVRFGPVLPGVVRRRRSPLEHVRALAAALAARRGHDIAIAALLRGLRRRLQPGTPPGRDPRPWLADLARHARAPAAREAAARLAGFTRPGQSSLAVLRTAHAVEDLWQQLR